MQHDLAERLYQNGISKEKFKMNVDITPVTTTDPEVININYDSVLTFSIDGMDGNQYILQKVKVEVSGRSMSEPVSEIALDSMIDQVYPKAPFAEQKFMVHAVLPECTFLEKIFLLHEEFAKPNDLIRVERMSRQHVRHRHHITKDLWHRLLVINSGVWLLAISKIRFKNAVT